MTTDYAIFIEAARLRVPACMLWPVPSQEIMSIDLEDDALISPRMLAWQDDRCAICGMSGRGSLVVDHCHVFGHVRGMLCRSCNTLEGTSDGSHYVRYRSGWNPATLLGYRDEYVNPVTGQVDLSSDGRWLRMTPDERVAYDQRLVDIVAALPAPRFMTDKQPWTKPDVTTTDKPGAEPEPPPPPEPEPKEEK